MNRSLAIICAVAVFSTSANAADRVYDQGGNIFLERNGTARQLTRAGRDRDPVLSPDGRFIVFTRKPAAPSTDDQCHDPPRADALMQIGIDGSGEILLVQGRSADRGHYQVCEFDRKQFTSDGRLLYFLAPAWQTSAALHVHDLRTKTTRFVVDANDLLVLNACRNEHKDRIVIQRHKYFVFGGSYDWFWLYDPIANKEVGAIGELDNNISLAKQAEEWCKF